MNILVAVPFLCNGGAERALFNLAVYFLSKGHRVSILAASNQIQGNMNIPENLKVYQLQINNPLTNPSFISSAKKIVPILKELQPDVVLCNSDYLNISLLLAKKWSRLQFKIVISHQYNSSSNFKVLPLKNKWFLQFLQKIIGKYSDAIVGCSKGVAEDFASIHRLPYPIGKVSAIYNPIYDESIAEKSVQEVSNVNFDSSKINIISVGRLAPQKDFETLLKAFSFFNKSKPQSHLYIIGEGPLENQLKTYCETLSIKESVSFLGYCQNPYAYVAKCQLFVLSSIYEGFGNVLVESMAVGTNVVATNCPSGPSEIIEDGKYGFLSEVGNATMLAQKMEQALANPFPKEVLINRAKEFSIQNSGDQYLCLMQSLLKRN